MKHMHMHIKVKFCSPRINAVMRCEFVGQEYPHTTKRKLSVCATQKQKDPVTYKYWWITLHNLYFAFKKVSSLNLKSICFSAKSNRCYDATWKRLNVKTVLFIIKVFLMNVHRWKNQLVRKKPRLGLLNQSRLNFRLLLRLYLS